MFSGYEIPNDPSLPHLSTALDEMEMANRFQKLLFIAEPHSKNAARVRHWSNVAKLSALSIKPARSVWSTIYYKFKTYRPGRFASND